MKLALLIACAVLTTACSTAPPSIDYTFEEFKAVEAESTPATALPSLKPLQCYPTEDACEVVGYTDGEDVDRLEAYREISESNVEVADNNAQALDVMLEREDAILAAAKAQESITKLREEQLAWERAERTREKWYYRVLIVLVGAAGVYAAN